MMQNEYPGIWKITLGEPEAATPVRLRHYQPAVDSLEQLVDTGSCPVPEQAVNGRKTARGYVVEINLDEDEQLYGLGLQLLSFNQRDTKKTLRVNSDPMADLGDSHAPVPFYASTKGYAILVDTARYATFYAGSTHRRKDRSDEVDQRSPSTVINSTPDHVDTRQHNPESAVIVEVPHAPGVDLYIFSGPSMLEAVQRYNLFSGGGCVPARWGLGVWYRCRADFDQEHVQKFAEDFRTDSIPCDVLGLEPGWQTHSYSCSFVWSSKFPQPRQLASSLAAQHYHLNLWTHAFIHASSPVYTAMLPYSGDYEVWQGLVPDLTLPEARRILGDFYQQEHIAMGVSGYKLDECDNSDYNASHWSFPELSSFPSGIDGEQFHSLLGIHYQETVDTIYRRRNQRSYNEVRSSHALAAPYPFVLYSDLYAHKDFIRGLVNCGFSGLLWSPEVRHATSAEDLIRRLQLAVLSPQALINAWYIRNPPWKQWDTTQNNADVRAPDYEQVENACRELLRLRMQFIPYLYAAFHRYHDEGIPPFRALVMDYPQDRHTWKLDDQYVMGDRVMVAPVIAGMHERAVYLPEGDWVDFWNGTLYAGCSTIQYPVPMNIIPIFVKAGSVLPLAVPTLHTEDPASYRLAVKVFGNGSLPMTLVEDDGVTYNYVHGAQNRLTLTWDDTLKSGSQHRVGLCDCQHYEVMGWDPVQTSPA